MIVKFEKVFRVPGFGRNRFPKGVVRDVPEAFRDRLPTGTVILPDDYPTEEALARQEEMTLAEQDMLRQQGTDADTLAKAGYMDTSAALSQSAFDKAVAEKVAEQVEAAMDAMTRPKENSTRKQGGKQHA